MKTTNLTLLQTALVIFCILGFSQIASSYTIESNLIESSFIIKLSNSSDTIFVIVNIGKEKKPAQNVSGLEFVIRYDSTDKPMMKGSAIVNLTHSWIFKPGETFISINYEQEGVYFGLKRMDGKLMSGYGLAASIIMIEDIDGKKSNQGYKKESNKSVIIYPNPSEGLLFISLPEKDRYIIRLFNLNDKVLFISKFNRGGLISINASHLPKGIYFMVINSSKGILSRKIILAY